MKNSSDLKISNRHLPHWELAGSYYYITFRTRRGALSDKEQGLLKGLIIAGHKKYYQLVACIVMPDHVHMVLCPNDGVELSRVLKGIKGKSARAINRERGSSGTIWQSESFDRIIRDDSELLEKLNYILDNPVRAGLTTDPWQYEGWFFNFDLAAAPQ